PRPTLFPYTTLFRSVEIQQQISDYLKENAQIDALIFATNYLGVNGLKAIRSLFPQQPCALGIVAFDNHDLFELHTPSITTIAQRSEEHTSELQSREN